jgi:hypothetical protein
MSNQRDRKRQRKRQRRQEQRRAAAAGPSRRPVVALAAIVVLLAAAGILVFRWTQSSSQASATPTPTSPVKSVAAQIGKPVDGVTCSPLEQIAYHIHQHLALYRDGKPVTLPSEIGIPGGDNNPTCFYWIHVHNFDPGILHVESPVRQTLPLGDFFDIWRVTQAGAVPPGAQYVQQLAAAARRHDVTVFVNGKRWTRGYRTVPLKDHEVITVEIGKPVVAPKPFTDWSNV